MKKTYLNYETPKVELIEVAVECAIAASPVGQNEDFEGVEKW